MSKGFYPWREKGSTLQGALAFRGILMFFLLQGHKHRDKRADKDKEMKIVSGTISHESSTFTPLPTTRSSFEDRFGRVSPSQIISTCRNARISTVFPETYPSAPAPRDVFDSILNEMLVLMAVDLWTVSSSSFTAPWLPKMDRSCVPLIPGETSKFFFWNANEVTNGTAVYAHSSPVYCYRSGRKIQSRHSSCRNRKG